jgi:hypothetical protein
MIHELSAEDGLDPQLWLDELDLQQVDSVVMRGVFVLADSFKLGTARTPVRGVEFDFRDATFMLASKVTQFGSPILRLPGAQDVTVLGGTFIGDNPEGRDAVFANKEGWHGIAVGTGAQRVKILAPTIRDVWGDGIAIGAGTNSDITIDVADIETVGRCAYTVRSCDRLTIRATNARRVRRFWLNHEATPSSSVTDLHCYGNVSHSGNLGFAQFKPTERSVLANVLIEDHRLTRGHYRVAAKCGGTQRDQITLRRLATEVTSAAQNMPLLVFGGTAAGWDRVIVENVCDVVADPARAVKTTNCADCQIDLSGFVGVG